MSHLCNENKAFQKNYELYINDSIGFNNDFIRLRNQIDYSIFNKCHSSDIEIGKDNYLVATTHLDAALGKTKKTAQQLDTIIKSLVFLNDTLQKLNKKLTVVFAPSKGSYCLDKAPDWYDTGKKGESDYEYLSRNLKNTTVKTIDFNNWFLQQKQTTKHKLYTRTGVHWSIYGATLAADSMFRFMEKNSNIQLRNLNMSKSEKSDTTRFMDGDLADALNLFWCVKDSGLSYPIYDYENVPKSDRKVLILTDSYFYSFANMFHETFNEYSFWYYNTTIYSSGPNNGKNVSDINIPEEIMKQDEFILIATQSTVGEIGWGFLDDAVSHFRKNPKMEYYINKIKADPAWYAQILEQAKKNKLTVQRQLEDDARYLIGLEKK